MKKIYFFLSVVIVACGVCNLYSMKNEIVNVQLRKYVKANNQEKVCTLLEQKADINAFSNEGLNPLIIAIHNDKLEMIKILLDRGANPCAEYHRAINRDFFYYMGEKDLFSVHKYHYPIIEAAKRGNLDCLKMLIINYNVDLFFVEKNQGLLSFDYLVERDHQTCVKMILKYVKEVDLRNFSDLSLIDYFKSLPDSCYKDSLRMLIQYFSLLKKHSIKIGCLFPRPVIFMIIKMSLDPYYPRLHELLEKNRIKSYFFQKNVLELAPTEEMKNLLLEHKKFLNTPTESENSRSYFCCIS